MEYSQINDTVDCIADLLAIENPADGQTIYVKSYHDRRNQGGGYFKYDVSKINIFDGGNNFNGWVRDCLPTYLNLLNFGAFGNNTDSDDDTLACYRLTDAVNNLPDNARFIMVHIPRAEGYLVGIQGALKDAARVDGMRNPIDLINKSSTEKTIVLKCDKAVFKLRGALQYGTFDKDTGEPYHPIMPFYGSRKSYKEAVAAGVNFSVRNLCSVIKATGNINLVMSGALEIDSNSTNMIIGGQYGDTGHQVRCRGFDISGLKKFDLDPIYTHHSCLDGFYIDAYDPIRDGILDTSDCRGIVRNLTSLNNGRMCLTIVGGHNIEFHDIFLDNSNIDSMPVVSAPASCIDVEAQGGKQIRNIRFYGGYVGEAKNNSFVADSGDSGDIRFHHTRFVNPNGSAIWAKKPNIRFYDCYINGTILKVYAADNDDERTMFIRGTITDDPVFNPNYTANQILLRFSGGNAYFEDVDIIAYTGGFAAINSRNTKTLIEFNDVRFIARHSDPLKSSVHTVVYHATGLIRFRDERPAAMRINQKWVNNIYEGTVLGVVEALDDLPSKSAFWGIRPVRARTVIAAKTLYDEYS